MKPVRLEAGQVWIDSRLSVEIVLVLGVYTGDPLVQFLVLLDEENQHRVGTLVWYNAQFWENSNNYAVSRLV